MPELRVMLGYKIVLGASAQDILPRLYIDVVRQVANRAQKLLAEIVESGEGQRSSCRADHLRRLIDSIEEMTTVV